MKVFLIGFMGSGKTSTGKELAKLLDYRFVDMDDLIVQRAGMSIPEIFSRFGEERFREIETEVLRDLVNEDDLVVSCGGGVVVKERNHFLLKQGGKVVFLMASPEVIYERVKDDTNRPLLNVPDPMDRIRDLLNQRMEKYLNVSDLQIDTDGRSPSEVAEEIARLIRADG